MTKQDELGSPPQVRGKPLKKAIEGGENRITPAGAGKTEKFHLPQDMRQDHPRRCGENVRAVAARSVHAGSPPQVRGKPPEDFPGAAAFRITPAGAGKTRTKQTYQPDKTDHPRRCGENSVMSARLLLRLGSPPQVRGKRLRACPTAAQDGITPAGAGKTEISARKYYPVPDHPRRCGENTKKIL